MEPGRWRPCRVAQNTAKATKAAPASKDNGDAKKSASSTASDEQVTTMGASSSKMDYDPKLLRHLHEAQSPMPLHPRWQDNRSSSDLAPSLSDPMKQDYWIKPKEVGEKAKHTTRTWWTAERRVSGSSDAQIQGCSVLGATMSTSVAGYPNQS